MDKWLPYKVVVNHSSVCVCVCVCMWVCACTCGWVLSDPISACEYPLSACQQVWLGTPVAVAWPPNSSSMCVCVCATVRAHVCVVVVGTCRSISISDTTTCRLNNNHNGSTQCIVWWTHTHTHTLLSGMVSLKGNIFTVCLALIKSQCRLQQCQVLTLSCANNTSGYTQVIIMMSYTSSSFGNLTSYT